MCLMCWQWKCARLSRKTSISTWYCGKSIVRNRQNRPIGLVVNLRHRYEFTKLRLEFIGNFWQSQKHSVESSQVLIGKHGHRGKRNIWVMIKRLRVLSCNWKFYDSLEQTCFSTPYTSDYTQANGCFQARGFKFLKQLNQTCFHKHKWSNLHNKNDFISPMPFHHWV